MKRSAACMSESSPRHRVFVYGSLLRGLHNHHLLRSARRVKAPTCTASSEFVLLDSREGYPFAVSGERAREGDARSRLVGEVYEVSDAELERLDELENHPNWYLRTLQPVEDDDKSAWIYLMEDEEQLAAFRSDPASFPAVATAGDWRAHLHETVWAATRLTAASSGPHAVFCYGSNGVAQLRQRVHNSQLVSVPATLHDADRVFGGWSDRWEGAVASIIPSFTGRAVRGSVVMLSDSELKLLDGFEGCDSVDVYGRGGVYRRQDIEVHTDDGKRSAVTYVKNCLEWRGPPSEAYLGACRTHLREVWDAGEAVVEIRDRTGELRE